MDLVDCKSVVNAENEVETEAWSSNTSVISLGAGGTCVTWKREDGGSEPKTYNPPQGNQCFEPARVKKEV